MVQWIKANKWWTMLIVLVFLLALWVRLDFITSVRHTLSHDMINYDKMVNQLLDEGIYAYKEEVPNARVTPGYPLFMTAMYVVGDQIGIHPFTLIRYVQVLISVATLAFMYLIAMQITKRKWVALITIFVAAIYHPFIWSTGTILTETLALFLLLAYLAMQLHVFKTQSKLYAAFAGILLGLCVLVRPEFLPIFAALYGVYLLQQWSENKSNSGYSRVSSFEVFKKVALLGVITGLCLSALMLPWWIRNIVSLNEFVLTATQSNPFTAGTYPNKDYTDKIVVKTPEMTQEEYGWLRLKTGFKEQTWTYVKWYTVGKLKYVYGKMFFTWAHEPRYVMYPLGKEMHLALIGGALIPLLVTLWRWRHPAVMISTVLIVMSLIRLVFVPEYRYNFTVMPIFIILSVWLGVFIIQKLWSLVSNRRAA